MQATNPFTFLAVVGPRLLETFLGDTFAAGLVVFFIVFAAGFAADLVGFAAGFTGALDVCEGNGSVMAHRVNKTTQTFLEAGVTV